MSNEKMKFSYADLEQWVEKELITPKQLTAIRAHIESAGALDEQSQAGSEQRKGLNFVSIAYYFGAFMILLAYTFFMGIQWESLGVNGQIIVSLSTIAVLSTIGTILHSKGFRTAGGLLLFVATGIVPLLVYSVQRAFGFWDDSGNYYRDYYQIVSKTWIPLELISIAAAVFVIWRVRFPLISLLIAFWTWYFSLDLTRWIAQSDSWDWSNRELLVGTWIGAAMLALGVYLQRRATQDYSKWFYLFGHMIILTHLWPLTTSYRGQLGLVFISVYLAFVIASVWLQRRVFLVFGAIGCYWYLSYLAFAVFGGALGFVYALASIGLIIILTAVGYQKYARKWLEKQLRQYQFSKP